MSDQSLEAQDIVYALAASPGFARDGVCFAARASGLYRSDNGGNNWIKIGSGLPDGVIFALAVDPGNPSTVYAAPSAGGLYRSTDAGASFTLVPGLRIPIVNAIAIDPANGSQIYTGTQFNPGDAFVMKIVP